MTQKLPAGAPPRPGTPRGVEPVLRRGPKREWLWRYSIRWTDPVSRRRKVEEFDTISEAEDFRAHLLLARRRGALEELTPRKMTPTDGLSS